MSKHNFDFEKEYDDTIGEIIIHAVGYKVYEKGSRDCPECCEYIYQSIEAKDTSGNTIAWLPDYEFLDEQAEINSEEDEDDDEQ